MRRCRKGLAERRWVCRPVHVEVVVVMHQGLVADVTHFERCVVVHRVRVTVMAVMTGATVAAVAGVGAVMPAVITVSVVIVPDRRVGAI